MFLIYFLLEHYFPNKVNEEGFEIMGWISIATMIFVIILEFIEMLTELVIDGWRLIRKIRLKTKII
jgi:hypothetical protein